MRIDDREAVLIWISEMVQQLQQAGLTDAGLAEDVEVSPRSAPFKAESQILAAEVGCGDRADVLPVSAVTTGKVAGGSAVWARPTRDIRRFDVGVRRVAAAVATSSTCLPPMCRFRCCPRADSSRVMRPCSKPFR